jgi:hypothetical protein
MVVLPSVLNLDRFDSRPLIPLEARAAGTYTQKLLVDGNAILSSLFIESFTGSPTLKINYYDTSTGQEIGERNELKGHDELSAGAVITDRVVVTGFHNKIVVEAVVTGAGSVTFGVYGTTNDNAGALTDLLEKSESGLVTEKFDYISLTYVASGNGEGEVETATYKDGGAGGTQVALLTITYDSSDRVSTVTKT